MTFMSRCGALDVGLRGLARHLGFDCDVAMPRRNRRELSGAGEYGLGSLLLLVFRQISNEVPVAIPDGGIDADGLNGGLEGWKILARHEQRARNAPHATTVMARIEKNTMSPRLRVGVVPCPR